MFHAPAPTPPARFAIFITVRTRSYRLPRKALALICGRTVMEHVIERARQVTGIDRVVVCTSTDPSDNVLGAIAGAAKTAAFHGSLEDKLVRWRDAARHFSVDYFVQYDADDVFCDPGLMETAIAQMRADPCDILTIPPTLVVGGSAFCLSADAVRRACDRHAEPADNWVPHITDSGRFAVRELQIADPRFHNQNIRLTLDYPEDLTFFRRVFDAMQMTSNTTPLRDIIEFLQQRPDIVAINWFRQHDYVENRKRLTTRVSGAVTQRPKLP